LSLTLLNSGGGSAAALAIIGVAFPEVVIGGLALSTFAETMGISTVLVGTSMGLGTGVGAGAIWNGGKTAIDIGKEALKQTK